MKNITIIWGSSGFWYWITEYLTKNIDSNKINITITWRRKDHLIKQSALIWCNYSLDNIEAVKSADIIVFSVPIYDTEKTILKVWPFIKKWSIVLDVTSIKQTPVKAFKKSIKPGVLIIPIHPMFGPYINSLSWQHVIFTPSKSTSLDKRYNLFKEELEMLWAKIIETSPKKHDKMMAIVQWLTHFNMFVIWKTLQKLKVNITESLDFISPMYKIMISSVERYMNQNPWLYWDIQVYNPEVLKVDKVFKQTAAEFRDDVKNQDKESFIKKVEKTQKYLWENAQKWQIYTDKLTYLVSKQTEKINNNIWNNINMINIYTWQELSWNLESFNNDKIVFSDKSEINIDEWDIL